MLYQPSFPNPYLSTIDANNDNVFRFKVNGDIVSAYQILIYNASTGELVYESKKYDLSPENYVYGNDGDNSFIEVTIPSSKTDSDGNTATILTNGLDYVWKAKVWQPTYDIEVAKGRVYENVGIGETALKIRPHIEDTVKKDMVLKIGTNQYQIKSCVLQYPKIYASISTHGYLYIDRTHPGASNLKSGTYVTIGGLGNSYNKNTTTGIISSIGSDGRVSFQGDNVIANYFINKDVAYIQDITPSLYSDTELVSSISNTITAGEEYVILSDNVECDAGFYFKARKSPNLTIYNNDIEITDNTIQNNNSSVNIRAKYEQEQGSNIKRWNITLRSNNNTVDTTGDIYNNKVEYIYNALLPQEYTLNLLVEGNDGSVIEKNILIDVEYNNANALLKPKVKLVYDSAVEINWSDSVNIVGESNSDDIEYDGQSIALNKEQYILWDKVDNDSKLNMEDPTIIKTLVTNLDNYNGSILEVFDSTGTDKIEVGYDSSVFWWIINDEKYAYNPYSKSISEVGVSDNTPSDVLYLWDDSNDVVWNDSEESIWHYNDVGEMYWWLIQINIYEGSHSNMVTFTKYGKE